MLIVRTLRRSALAAALAALACGADVTGPPSPALAPPAFGLAADGGVITPDPPAPADSDGDGVFDDSDNCPFTPNPDQADADNDGIGDACPGEPGGGGGGDDGCVEPDPSTGEAGACPGEDGDLDGDGVPDSRDNCVDVPNSDQADADGDGIGDACAGEPGGGGDGCVVPDPATGETDPGPCPEDDGDLDGDGVPDGSDNCTWMENTGQSDADGDGTGDACDVLTPGSGPADGQEDSPAESADRDIDGVPDATDNCPAVPNRFQIDRDGDGIGDICDPSSPLERLAGPLTDFLSRLFRPGG